MSEAVLKACGGRKIVLAGADPNDPANEVWNFGINPATPDVVQLIQEKPTFHARFPKLVGKWDGKSTVNHYLAAQKVLREKSEDLIQYQPRGTCGGRAGSATGDLVQCVLIAAGQGGTFTRVSHAAVYYAARKLYGMLGGNWRDDGNDGVANGAVPEALKKVTGYVGREEIGDTNYYGEGSDDLACKLGAGMLPDVAQKILSLGSDNLVEWFPVKSAAEAADGIAAGGILIGSDNQGFTMTRDGDGFCSPRGQWAHYHTRCSINVLSNGRKGFGYWQSWSRDTPSGTRLQGHPGNCFGVDFDVQDRCIRSGSYAIVTGFPLWKLEDDKVNVDWIF